MRLNLGSGNSLYEGYTNIDFFAEKHVDVNFDLSKPLTELYELDTAEEIKAYHILEHLSIQVVPEVLRSWYEVLKLGGILDIELPDFSECVRWYLRTKSWDSLEWIYGNQERRGQFHHWGYTKESLKDALVVAGFSKDGITFKQPQTFQAESGPCFRVIAQK